MVEDLRDTYPGHEGRSRGAILTAVWSLSPKTTPALRMTGFQLGLASKPGVGSFDGNWRRHVVWSRRVRQGKVTLCEVCGRQMKTPRVGLFCPGGVDMLYVNRSRLGNRNNPLYREEGWLVQHLFGLVLFGSCFRTPSFSL
jgi:hypothetical protein